MAGDEIGLSAARERADRIEEELRNRICLLDYPPGMRLSETALAEEFGISRTPLRRVLTRLESAGLLEAVHGVGTFVTSLADSEIDQIYRLRIELATLAARLDPVPPSPALIERFRALARRARALPPAPDTPRPFAQVILDFILAQSELSANAPLMEVTRQLYVQTARIWVHSLFAADLDLSAELAIFAREVEEVLNALETPDLEAAAAIHRAHVSMSYQRLKRLRATQG